MKKDTITNAKYLQLVGLLALAEKHDTILRSIEEAACEITGENPDDCGHTSDAVFGSVERDADILLSRLGIQRQNGNV